MTMLYLRMPFTDGHPQYNTGRTWLKKGHQLNKGRKLSKKHIKAYQDKYREENLEKVRARDFVKSAIKRYGLRKRPCMVCGGTAEAHHWRGYSKEHYLDIQWLCPTHHYEAENSK